MSAWRAKIDGFDVDLLDVTDEFRQALARHRFPYRDGATLEPLGLREREIRLRAVWMPDRYDEHFSFLSGLRARTVVQLTHPVYGVLRGAVESVSVRHDELERTAEAELLFVEGDDPAVPFTFATSGVQAPLPPARHSRDPAADVVSAVEDEFVAALEEEVPAAAAAEARTALGVEAEAFVAAELDAEATVLEQLTGLSRQGRAYAREVDAAVAAWRAKLVEVTNPANTLTALLSFGVNVPGRVIGALALAVERHAIALESLRSAPARFLRSLWESRATLEAASERFAGAVRAVWGARLALEAAGLYGTDALEREALKRAEGQAAFDLLGRYLGREVPGAVLSVRELEQTLALVRGGLQVWVDADREAAAPKTLALLLADHVSRVKLEREKIATAVADAPLPLHALCLREGLPYTYAPRVLALNRVRHPSFVAGEVSVYAR